MGKIFENNAESSSEIREIEPGFDMLTCANETEKTAAIKETVGDNIIQFHFCTRGAVRFSFNEGQYHRKIEAETSLLLYNPQKILPLDVRLAPQSAMLSLLISIKKFHRFFSEDTSYIHFLKTDKQRKKYYQEQNISPAAAVVLNQMLNAKVHPSVLPVYLRGKAYELIGLYFNRSEKYNLEQCPFLADEANVRKLKEAKEIIIERLADPPTLKALSEEIGLSLKNLKQGFKEVYGDTVFGFLFDYKMGYARKLLETGHYNVNEVAFKIGYSTGSHFISAFKKKFGTTPKKYVQYIE